MCPPLASKDDELNGEEGLLVLTNFKLSFISNDEAKVNSALFIPGLTYGR